MCVCVCKFSWKHLGVLRSYYLIGFTGYHTKGLGTMHFNSIYYLNCLKTSVDEGKGWIDRKGRKEENKKE